MSSQADMFGVSGGAEFSDCGVYRYRLWRRWGPGSTLVWIMLNPSTADAENDDPTIRKCIKFSRRARYGALGILNLFALRATDPAELYRHPDPVGPRNLKILTHALNSINAVMLGWGAHAERFPDHLQAVTELARAALVPVRCLGVTKAGQPRHPLYLRADTDAVAWPTVVTPAAS